MGSLTCQRLRPAMHWIVGTWTIGVLVLCLYHAGGWIAVRRLSLVGLRRVEPSVERFVGRIAQRLSVTRAVRVVESFKIDTPMVIGWIRPVVLLPSAVLSG